MGSENLAGKRCRSCESGVRPLDAGEARELLKQAPGWEMEGEKAIGRKFRFDDFRQAQSWLNCVADIAENEGHHPDIQWNYTKVAVTLTTHSIGGLSENDFILAAKINELD